MTGNDSLPSLPPAGSTTVDVYEHYRIRHIPWDDSTRQSAYQRLRADIFVRQLKWKIPVDEQGRERDRYDTAHNSAISVHCVYGISKDTNAQIQEQEHLLGGVRIFQLQSWEDSMVAQEFRQAKMVPAKAIRTLEKQYDPTRCLELTRLCVQRRHWYSPTLQTPIQPSPPQRFNLALARDFTYATVYQVAEQTKRYFALALVDEMYLRVMKRSHFIFDEVYARRYKRRLGHSLTVIDLSATIRAIQASGDSPRAERMSILCSDRGWLSLLVQQSFTSTSILAI